MYQSLELQIARSKIERYEHDADEALHAPSKQARHCQDCDAFLSAGIAALRWLQRAEEVIHEGAAEGFVEITLDLEEALESLHAAWLRPCAFAEKWIAECREHGYELSHLPEFRLCCESAREWLDRNQWYRLSRAAREQRFEQQPW